MSDKPSIFISAPTGTKTGVLRTMLIEGGATVVDAFDFAAGETWHETITSRISKADGVLVVYSEASSNVAFEMGISVGLKKPTFVLLDPAAPVPSFVQSCLHLRSTIKDTEILRASLARFVQEVKTKRRRKRTPVKLHDQSQKTEPVASFLGEIRRYRETAPAFQLEKVVTEILKSSGLQVESQSSPDVGVDCVVWSDRLSETMGNPILVEVKSGNVDADRLLMAEQRLHRYLAAAGAHYGILLYLDRAGRRFNQQSNYPTILRFELEDFMSRLQRQSFEEVVLAERNRAVHGGEA